MFATICRLYETHSDAMRAMNALRVAGVPAESISIISNNSDRWFTPDTPAADAKSANVKPAKADSRSSRAEGGLIGAAIGAAAGTAGTMIGTAATVIGGLTLLTIPGVGPAVGAGWLLGLMAAGAAVGGLTGSVLGALTNAGVNEADAQVYAEGLRRGGSLLAARVPLAQANRVESVMNGGAINIQERNDDYRRSGWRSFDPAASPYSADQVRRERQLHQAA